jgi:carbon-monoxide dehydrogenase medium subunit
MKAAPFAYVRPTSLSDALAELAGEDAKVIAGGQSLVPVMAMRLGRPATLVDINAIPDLDRIVLDGDHLEIGAIARQRAVETHPEATRRVPLLGLALPWVGHRELRSRGTVCGSLAHADPAAELCAVASCLDAHVTVGSRAGTRSESARSFFAGVMTTSLGPGEVLLGARFPVAETGDGFGFAEVARRHGDFALAGVVTWVRMVDDGAVASAILTVFGVSDRPVTVDVTAVLTGNSEEPGLLAALAEVAERVVTTDGDAHGSRGYRIRLVTHLAARELATAHAAAAASRRGNP